jgi:hypothetical protein
MAFPGYDGSRAATSAVSVNLTFRQAAPPR